MTDSTSTNEHSHQIVSVFSISEHMLNMHTAFVVLTLKLTAAALFTETEAGRASSHSTPTGNRLSTVLLIASYIYCTVVTFAKYLPVVPNHLQVKGSLHVQPRASDIRGEAPSLILPQIQAKTISAIPSGFSSVLPSHKSTSHGHFLPHVFSDTRAPSKVE